MKYELQDISGQVVVITGATSGIGAAAARQFVAEGAKVVLNARNKERLAGMVAELGEENALAVAGDTADPNICREVVKQAVAKFGKVDVVVPNAGIGKYGSVLDYTDDEVNEMMRTNFEGTVHIVRAALPEILKTGAGDVVIVSSVAGFRGGGVESIYAGTKHAQVGFAGALDRELSEKNVRVALVCPAGTETEFALGAGRTPDMPMMKKYLRPDDVGFQIVTIVKQPRNVRTHIWTLWSIHQPS